MPCAEIKHVDAIVPSSPADCCSLQNFTRLMTEIKLLIFKSLKYQLQFLCELSLIYKELVLFLFLVLVPHK